MHPHTAKSQKVADRRRLETSAALLQSPISKFCLAAEQAARSRAAAVNSGAGTHDPVYLAMTMAIDHLEQDQRQTAPSSRRSAARAARAQQRSALRWLGDRPALTQRQPLVRVGSAGLLSHPQQSGASARLLRADTAVRLPMCFPEQQHESTKRQKCESDQHWLQRRPAVCETGRRRA